MKRFFPLVVCTALVLPLASCDTWWGLIVSGITGKGYYQVGWSSISNASSNLASSSIDLSGLTATSSVIIYQTTFKRYYGKLTLASGYSADSITITFETYDGSGNSYYSKTAATISNGYSISLENGNITNGSTSSSDFTFTAPNLVPANNATFYLYSE